MWIWRIVCAIALVSILETADALKCYQCSSSIDVHCTENINVEDTNLALEDCSNIHDAGYCIKTTGIYNGEVGTTRFCSSENLGFICDFQKRMGDVREYRGCLYTCNSDGCNSSPHSHAPTAASIIAFLGLALLALNRWRL
ncbi:hypothetical protein CHUAL_009188 [Chamberlinius hualienensis]